MKEAQLRFSHADQLAFATFSGDFNPVHVDALAARRMAAGAPIVHGMHALLRAFDRRAAKASTPLQLNARFERPVVVGDTVRVESANGRMLSLTRDDGLPLVTVTFEEASEDVRPADMVEKGQSHSRTSSRPRARTLQDMEGAAGVVALRSSSAATRLFPHATRALGPIAVGALAAISRVVGMECPGRDSLLSAISVRIDPAGATRQLHWRVSRVDSRFRLVRITVDGGGIRGTVDAFLRPALAGNPTLASVASQVERGEFAGQRALIVGGSRGLGAATALIVTAGGGAPLVTYAVGKAEAASLRREAAKSSQQLEIMQFDVVRDSAQAITQACRRFRPTHLYYFATPRIFGRRRDPFDAPLFTSFSEFYVSGFAAVCLAATRAATPLTVLFPSTTALDGDAVRDLTEYAAAKAAGELVCRALSESTPGLNIVVRRLPRVSTDQTATILPVPAADPVAVLLPIIREMHQRPAPRQ